REKCDFVTSIPLHGKVQSMNVSTAAAVILAEAARQRDLKKE
ncbi:MAG: 23S rRNA (guanosine(2251)-2'-O)-methyltransferase RlmB, partial [Clostridia bacterium]|nr:23S rRNA (guanosine(2251)-2'-O)-methyltransferase RlmB [Clostridia bacterium]